MRSDANLPRYDTDLKTGELTDLGQLARYGCYPLFYATQDNNALCYACARKIDEDEDETDRIVAAGINYEDASLYCEDCGRRIESAYAEDDAEDGEIS